MEPIVFQPIYQERVWGGRELERVFGRTLPEAGTPFGEAWEVVDRPEAQSVVCGGEFAGLTLQELWSDRREEIFGAGYEGIPRFPVLIKILDARDDLSIQVHPPESKAAALGGEPKTEMWYIVDCAEDARLYVGLKNGVTKEDFERAIADGTVEGCVHAVSPRPGESIFIRSGRLHAIGAGFLIFEIQQNSDTTYRVFDWNRMGLDGKPRQLHVEESLASIDFADFEPGMDLPQGGVLASCEYFKVEKVELAAGEALANPDSGRFMIVAVVKGGLATPGGRVLPPGTFALMPKEGCVLTSGEGGTVLRVTVPVPL
ncbi:MAG: class I mannose-6-phosphate isomerase [Verrucomicrobia bacterium]|nr:class I mannose-6-phosphate isomerase [Verrucomicrobiota bacterium]